MDLVSSETVSKRTVRYLWLKQETQLEKRVSALWKTEGKTTV